MTSESLKGIAPLQVVLEQVLEGVIAEVCENAEGLNTIENQPVVITISDTDSDSDIEVIFVKKPTVVENMRDSGVEGFDDDKEATGGVKRKGDEDEDTEAVKKAKADGD